jgi:FkbH-like protein
MAAEWMRFLHPVAGHVAKVLVADLDDTLWGGVVGEDGVEGLHIGRDYPGAAFRELQRAMLDLRRRGILLAAASKNNPSDALAALTSHPGMLLRPEHFSAMRLDWNDKAASLREIAAELNVGLDSLAFLDDNPAERRRIRLELPEVGVVELPPDPLNYARALRECPLFERLSLSGEDTARAEYYAGERLRDEARQAAGSLEEFYRSLEQKVGIAPVTGATLARAAQLTSRTNQFNLTTGRWTEARMAEFAAAPGCRVWTARVEDRFGDNGIVGLMMTRRAGAHCEIETFLLSCRVIGRTIETAMLAFLAGYERAVGAESLCGWFLPTPRNAPAEGFYRSHGFRLCGSRDDATRWSLSLAGAAVACPPWIALNAPEPARTGQVHA